MTYGTTGKRSPPPTTSTTTAVKAAAGAIAAADAILLTTGAGFGVDSGLPDFRGDEGFWKVGGHATPRPQLLWAVVFFHPP